MYIAQITDLHTVAKHQHWLMEPLTAVRSRISSIVETLNALDPAPAVVLLTGDATDEGSPEQYSHLLELLAPLKIPLFPIPGNHDLREPMRAAFPHLFPKTGYLHYVVDDYPVRLIALDSLVEGEGGGRLCPERFAWLEQTIRTLPSKPTLLFMHHPPVKVGVHLFDQIVCEAPPAFEQLIRDTDHILGLVVGHYHHLCVSSFGGKLCYLAPSVAPVHYFAHPEHDYVTAIELEDPAVSLHQWRGGRTLVTHVRRAKDKFHRLNWEEIAKKLQKT